MTTAYGQITITDLTDMSTYIKYSNSANSGAIYDSPGIWDIVYIGICTTTDTIAPTDRAEYTWTRLTGATGAAESIKSSDIFYCRASVGTGSTPSGIDTSIGTDGWSKEIPETTTTYKYLWTKVVITYTNSSVNTTSYSVSSTMDSIEVGGKNLLRNTGINRCTADNWLRGNASFSSGILKMIPASSVSYAKYIVDYLDYADYAGETFTASFDVRWMAIGTGYVWNSNNVNFYIGVNASGREKNWFNSNYDRYTYEEESITTTEWKRYSVTLSIPDDLTIGTEDALVEGSCISIGFYCVAKTYPIEIRNLKLEKGNVATDWTPAPEDVDTAIGEVEAKTNYIYDRGGETSDSGLWISNDDEEYKPDDGNSIVLGSTGMSIYKGTTEVASYGTDITLGQVASGYRNILIDADSGIYLRENTTNLASFTSSAAIIGKATSNRFEMGTSSLTAYDSSNTKYFEVSANGISFGTNTAATTTAVETAQKTANAAIKTSKICWYASSSTTVPSGPGSTEVTSTSNSYGVWTLAVPTWSTSYPYYYTCVQTQNNSGIWSSETVMRDYSITDANTTANAAKTAASAAQSAAEESAKTATTYLTDIDNNGIKITAKNNSNDYLTIDSSNGMKIYRSSNQVAQFGTNIILGQESSNHITINNNGFFITLPKSTSDTTLITAAQFTGSEVTLGSASGSGTYTTINSSGMTIKDNEDNKIASFGINSKEYIYTITSDNWAKENTITCTIGDKINVNGTNNNSIDIYGIYSSDTSGWINPNGTSNDCNGVDAEWSGFKDYYNSSTRIYNLSGKVTTVGTYVYNLMYYFYDDDDETVYTDEGGTLTIHVVDSRIILGNDDIKTTYTQMTSSGLDICYKNSNDSIPIILNSIGPDGFIFNNIYGKELASFTGNNINLGANNSSATINLANGSGYIKGGRSCQTAYGGTFAGIQMYGSNNTLVGSTDNSTVILGKNLYLNKYLMDSGKEEMKISVVIENDSSSHNGSVNTSDAPTAVQDVKTTVYWYTFGGFKTYILQFHHYDDFDNGVYSWPYMWLNDFVYLKDESNTYKYKAICYRRVWLTFPKILFKTYDTENKKTVATLPTNIIGNATNLVNVSPGNYDGWEIDEDNGTTKIMLDMFSGDFRTTPIEFVFLQLTGPWEL